MNSHPRLEKQLAELADSVDWPHADVATEVQHRIVARPNSKRRLRVGWKVAVAALSVMTAIMLVPAGRQAVADLLSVSGIEITFTDSETSTGPKLDLGESTSLEAASSHVDFPLALPNLGAIEEPDGIYLQDGEPAVVHMTWDAEQDLPAVTGTDIGLLLSEFASNTEATVLSKDLSASTDVVVTSVSGQRALWLEGAPHNLTYLTTDGANTPEVSRLAANVLIWESNDVTYRLESALDLRAAQQVAEALAVSVP